MRLSISLEPEQITGLARQINDTIASLTNIDAILNATAGDLAEAQALKTRADRAKYVILISFVFITTISTIFLITINSFIFFYMQFYTYRENAEAILDTAKQVLDALEEAQKAQDRAESAIEKANNDISAADIDLAQVSVS